jgi:NAD(P)-dependent dehydrogenase (short-subunit alcohol dehydrogenase family)
MFALGGKVVVITGAGAGMGREIALLCARRGALVEAADIDLEGARETADLIAKAGGDARATRVDVSDRRGVHEFAEDVVRTRGGVDAVINNAGIIPRFERFDESGYEVMERMLAVNFWGVVHGSREFIPHLLKRPQSALVNTSSVAGLLAYQGLAPYVASKFAVRGFTEALRMEYLKTGLKVTLVFPGAVATRIKEHSPFFTDEEKRAAKADFEDERTRARLTSAESAARRIVYGMQAGKARIVIGRDAMVQDFMARHMPVLHTKIFYGFLASLLPKRG